MWTPRNLFEGENIAYYSAAWKADPMLEEGKRTRFAEANTMANETVDLM